MPLRPLAIAKAAVRTPRTRRIESGGALEFSALVRLVRAGLARRKSRKTEALHAGPGDAASHLDLAALDSLG